MNARAKKNDVADLVELPAAPQVGDRIRLKEDRIQAYRDACRKAGWYFDSEAIYTVTREDRFNPGGGRRLFIPVPPHALGSPDVELAWSDESQRRAMLRADGWKV